MKSSILAALPFLLLVAVGQTLAQDKTGVRLIKVPAEENGYGNFESQVIESEEDFDAFVKRVKTQKSWNNRKGFLKALADADLDFTTESLVLVVRTEGSGSNAVRFAPPELKGEKLICTINRAVPEVGTADVAVYCFAVAVEKSTAKKVEVWVNTKGKSKPARPEEVLSLTAK